MSTHIPPEQTISFETAFKRLEEILDQMNSGKLPLDELIKLYEEADSLMAICNKQLNEAERKVETLIKNRNGELTLGNDERPITQEYKMASGRMGGHE